MEQPEVNSKESKSKENKKEKKSKKEKKVKEKKEKEIKDPNEIKYLNMTEESKIYQEVDKIIEKLLSYKNKKIYKINFINLEEKKYL